MSFNCEEIYRLAKFPKNIFLVKDKPKIIPTFEFYKIIQTWML